MKFEIFDKSDTMPAFCKPYPDELFSSWLTRLSFEHGLSKSRLLKATGIVPSSKHCQLEIDKWSDDMRLGQLARFANCDIQEIRATSLWSYENKLYVPELITEPRIPAIWLSKWYSDRLSGGSRTNVLYCPSCFANPAKPTYYRKQWRLAVSFVCMDCKCYLKDRCPNCNQGATNMNMGIEGSLEQSVRDFFLSCGRCKQDVSKCEPELASTSIIRLQTSINERLNQRYVGSKRYSVGFFQVLHKTTTLLLSKWINDGYYRFLEEIYEKNNVPYKSFNQTAVARLSLKDQANLYLIGHWLLEHWPGRFIKYCKKYNLPSNDLLRHYGEIPSWFSGPVSTDLEERLPAPTAKPRRRNVIQTESYRTEIYEDEHSDFYGSDYNYDPDDRYYSEGYKEKPTRYWFPKKNEYCANDIIFKQLKKDWEWN